MTTTSTEGLSADETARLVDRYVGVWNESDTQIRRDRVTELWAHDGVEYTDENEHQGHLAVEERIAEAYNEFVGDGQFMFRLADEPATHHNALSFTIEMIPQEGGQPVWRGVIFIALNSAGRIQRDYQFGRTITD